MEGLLYPGRITKERESRMFSFQELMVSCRRSPRCGFHIAYRTCSFSPSIPRGTYCELATRLGTEVTKMKKKGNKFPSPNPQDAYGLREETDN
jgi:hypothetical protein